MEKPATCWVPDVLIPSVSLEGCYGATTTKASNLVPLSPWVVRVVATQKT